MPPKKAKPPSRAKEDKRTNLKDILSRSSSTVSRGKSAGRVKDAASGPKATATEPITKLKNIRKLNAEDMAITPDSKRQTPMRKKQPSFEEHSTSVQVSLPISDTPIIRRNKQMRNGEAVRRSSLGKRGKRVSSIGNGFTGMPHDQVPMVDLYKHLDTTLPDPHKMRQLLTWCARRVSNEDKNKHVKQKNKMPSKELTALNIAKVIKEEIVRDLVDGKINISWWNRVAEAEEAEAKKVLLPNERNVKNQEVLDQLKLRLVTLKKSSESWTTNMSKLIELPSISLDGHATDEQFGKVLDKSLIDEISSLEESTYSDISQDLEFTLDSFNEFIHQLKSSSIVRNRFISQRSRQLSKALDSTLDDDTLHKINTNEHNKDLDTDQLLKGIAKLDG